MSGQPVTALVVTFDSAHALPDCLRALTANGIPAIVADNGSRDATVRLAEGQGAQVIRNARNEGYGRANNIAAREARTEFLLDRQPRQRRRARRGGGARGRGPAPSRRRAVRAEDRRALGPGVLPAALAPRAQSRHAAPAPGIVPDGEACAPFFSGACFLIRRELFVRLGGFDENIFLFYEDDDLCRRIADAGIAMIYVPQAIVRHGRGRSSGPERGRIFKTRWHQAWSRAYVSRKYGLPDPAPGMFVLNALKTRWPA